MPTEVTLNLPDSAQYHFEFLIAEASDGSKAWYTGHASASAPGGWSYTLGGGDLAGKQITSVYTLEHTGAVIGATSTLAERGTLVRSEFSGTQLSADKISVADFNDVSAATGVVGATNMVDFIDLKEVNLSNIPDYNGDVWANEGPFVTYNGAISLDGTRQYFISAHDGTVPGGWAAHDTISAHQIDLGSWTFDRQVLAKIDLTAVFSAVPSVIEGMLPPIEIGSQPFINAPAITKLTNGDYIVAWSSNSTAGLSIAFQRFSADGQAVTQIAYVPQPNGVANATKPSIMALPNGGFAIGSMLAGADRNFSFATYSSDNQLIGDRKFFGEPGWSYGADNIAATNGYVASASHSEAGGSGGNDGEGSWDVNFFVDDTAGNRLFSGKAATSNFNAQINGEVIALADGTSFLIAWADQSYQLENSEFGLYGRVFSTTSMSFSTQPFLINQITDGSQLGWGAEDGGSLSLTALPDGGFAAYWINDPQAGVYRGTLTNGSIQARIFDKVGSSYVAATDEFTIGANVPGNHNFVDVDQKPNGDMLSVFTVVDGTATRLIGEVIASDGSVLISAFVISNDVDTSSRPKVSWLADGSAVVAWTQDDASTLAVDDRKVVSQIIPASALGGSANQAPSITSNGGANSAALTMAENSAAVVTVTATDPDADTTLSYSISGGADAALFQINAATGALSFKTAPDFEAPADAGANNVYDVTVQVSDGSLTDTQALAVTITNVIEGTAASESLAGGAGDDIITANGGDDNLNSNAGNDRLYGEAGNDYLRGGYGNDLFDGGDGIDRVSFYAFNPSDPQVGVTLDLALEGIAQDTGHGFDTLIGIEQASGTIFADLIRGNALDNVLSGNSGDDSLEGRAGNDLLEGGPGTNVLDGGIGNDTATYLSAENAVLASLASGNSSGGDGVDTLISIENITGSHFDDELTGNAGNNILAGSFGADRLDGGNGNDLLLGDGAIRKLIVRGSGGPAEIIQDDGADASGVAGNDILIGGGGNDTLVGGVGNDTAVYDGAISDYTLLANSDGSTTIVDNRSSGSNGTDTLTGIEFLSFGGILYGIDGVPLNLPPTITSNGGGATANLSIAENARAVTAVTASDPDAGTTVAYSISGGADASLFQINAATGALSFKTAPNFETRADAGGNNVYDVIVQASDGSLTDTQALAVTVTNVNEQPSGSVTITGTGTVGSILAASHTVVDPDGPGTGGYQWTRNGTNITGATGANYTLTNADAGQAIGVKLTYTDGGGFRQSVASGSLSVAGLAPGVRIAGADTTTGEDGNAAVFSVSLDKAPVDPVTLVFSVSDGSEGSLAVTSLTFTSANWNVAQTLTINGVDDYLNDGTQTYALRTTIDTRDLAYLRLTVADVTLSNLDDGQDKPLFLYGDNEINYLTGGNGNDRIYAAGNMDELRGGRGDDRLYGEQDNDRLYGGEGLDQLYGGYDDDELYGEAGNDKLYGEAGDDRLEGGIGNDILDGGTGVDTMVGGAGNDTYYVDDTGDVIDDQGVSTDVDTVLVLATIQYTLAANVENASLGKDSGDAGLTGNTLANDLTGNSGGNTLAGGGGNDALDGGAGNDALNGGTGNDVLVGGLGNDKINGGTGVDTADFSDAQGDVSVDLGANRATGDGTDTLSSIENVAVGGGDDVVTGNAGANTLNGGSGNDTLTGGDGGDVLVGGTGSDTLYAGNGDDTVNAGSGDDVIVGGDGAGNDRYNGGTGVDTIRYTSAKAGIVVDLSAAKDQATSIAAGDAAGIGVDQLSSIENVIAGNYADRITGSSAANVLRGMQGRDVLNGAAGNDRLIGGTGRDSMTGGAGADSFVFDDLDFGGATTTLADRIVDFSRSQGDRIDLKLVDANTANGATDNAFTFIGTKAFSKVAGELRYVQSSGNTFVSGDTDGNGTADFMIRLDGLHMLTGADFVL